MNHCCSEQMDNGANPYVVNIRQRAEENQNFRTAIWTGCHLQMTLMCIPSGGEIGLEIHEDTDQIIMVEQGEAVVKVGKCKNQLNLSDKICEGDVVFIPAGAWHNIVNTGNEPLKVISVYAPSNHPKGTIQRTKADADREEQCRQE